MNSLLQVLYRYVSISMCPLYNYTSIQYNKRQLQRMLSELWLSVDSRLKETLFDTMSLLRIHANKPFMKVC